MEIVINKQFGGFRLSHKALMNIYELKNIKVFPYFLDMDYGDYINYEYVFTKVPCNYNTSLNDLGRSIWYLKNNPKCQSFSIASDGVLPETIDAEDVFGKDSRDTDAKELTKMSLK
ncbi:hypothetical protein [Enterococcus sp. AZ126]|uniref:hypothetical protein n=1 Tax=Enterococcus sp. AZ126 TaxID=2774635 RepID=UPI003F21B703